MNESINLRILTSARKLFTSLVDSVEVAWMCKCELGSLFTIRLEVPRQLRMWGFATCIG